MINNVFELNKQLNKVNKMISRIIAKKDTQEMIKALRAAGLTVTRLDSGYECYHNEKLVFKAMQGNNGYLVRMLEGLFD